LTVQRAKGEPRDAWMVRKQTAQIEDLSNRVSKLEAKK